MKYIIVADDNGNEHGIIFPKALIHRDVARIHSATRGPRVVSAGFCIIDEPIEAYGESESLDGLESREQDAEILRRTLGEKP